MTTWLGDVALDGFSHLSLLLGDEGNIIFEIRNTRRRLDLRKRRSKLGS